MKHCPFGCLHQNFTTFFPNKYKKMDWIYFLIVGALAGWLGSLLFKGSGSGLFMNIILGILGAIVGGWIFDKLNIETGGFSGSLITAAVGAFVILWVYRFLGGGRRR